MRDHWRVKPEDVKAVLRDLPELLRGYPVVELEQAAHYALGLGLASTDAPALYSAMEDYINQLQIEKSRGNIRRWETDSDYKPLSQEDLIGKPHPNPDDVDHGLSPRKRYL